MRKIILLVALTFLSTYSWAQTDTSWGIKGGLNYNGNGNYIESIGVNAQNPDRNVGYHIGLFGKLGNTLYFRPEIVYTNTKSDYDSGNFNMKKLDAPLLVGIKVIGPISVFGGPALQYILDSDFDGISINNVSNDFSVGLNFGAAINFKKFAIDLRYERGFSENEAQFLNNNNIDTSRLDTRPEQLILSLSIAL
jgi:Outer membrane protein beta-barrel domain